MKQIWNKIVNGDRHELVFLKKSAFMIVLFVLFFAVSFYVMFSGLME